MYANENLNVCLDSFLSFFSDLCTSSLFLSFNIEDKYALKVVEVQSAQNLLKLRYYSVKCSSNLSQALYSNKHNTFVFQGFSFQVIKQYKQVDVIQQLCMVMTGVKHWITITRRLLNNTVCAFMCLFVCPKFHR